MPIIQRSCFGLHTRSQRIRAYSCAVYRLRIPHSDPEPVPAFYQLWYPGYGIHTVSSLVRSFESVRLGSRGFLEENEELQNDL
jgi:hypothetical protein